MAFFEMSLQVRLVGGGSGASFVRTFKFGFAVFAQVSLHVLLEIAFA